MLAIARSLSAFLALAVAGCASPHPKPIVLSKHHVIDLQWRLTSAIFPTMPTGGFPIHFQSDGSLKTKNLGVVNRWELSDAVLRLYHNERELLDFNWLPAHGVFRSCYGKKGLPLFVFPAGSNALEIQKIRCEHFPPAVNQPLARLGKTWLRKTLITS
jgi:hypothetical protein